MRALALLATVLVVPASGLAEPRRATPPEASAAPAARIDCLNSQVRHAGPAGPGGPRSRTLGELPPGNLHLAVVREVAGCQEPVIVGYDVGRPRR